MNLFAIVLITLTTLLFIVLPLVITKKISLLFLVEIFFTAICYQSIYFITHLDEVHARFYKGESNFFRPEPDCVEVGFNVVFGFFSGVMGFFFYRFALSLFTPFLGESVFVIALFFGLMIALILISQYKKRVWP